MEAKPPSVAAVKRILDASGSPSLLVSAGETIVAANEAAAVLAGAMDPHRLVGSSLGLFDLDGGVSDRNRDLFRQVADGTVLTLTAVVMFRRLDGTASSVILAQTGLALADGLFVLLTATDDLVDGASTDRREPGDLAALVTDHDWRVTHATAAAAELLDGDDGPALFGLVHPMDIGPLASALNALTYSGSSTSLRLKVRRGGAWSSIVASASALCRHTPPRLVVLVADAPTWAGDEDLIRRDDRVDAALVGLASVAASGPRELSDQEMEILARSLRGQGPAEIAQQMFLNRGTVRNALTRLYRRFGVRSQAALVAEILSGRASNASSEPQ
ncbi:MAG: helix-turn-helix transcriptional regulator [Acidimicrobiales bacterium]